MATVFETILEPLLIPLKEEADLLKNDAKLYKLSLGCFTLSLISTLSEHMSLFVKLLFTIGGINSGLALTMTHFHLAQDFLQSRIASRQELIQERPNIPAT